MSYMLLRKRIYSSIAELRVQDVMYILAFSLFCIASFLDLSVWFYEGSTQNHNFGLVLKMTRYFAYLCCILKLILDAYYSRKRYIYLAVSAGLIILNVLVAHDKRMIFYFLMIIAAKDVSHDIIIRIFLIINLVLLFATVMAARYGILEDYVQDELRQRHYLGFSWTTNGPIIWLFIILSYIYLKKGEINIFETAILSGVALWFFKMTDSRFVILISMAATIFFGIIWKSRLVHKITARLQILFISSPFWIAAVAIVLHYLYDEKSSFWRNFNDLLSNRLRLGNDAINKYGFSLFGKAITWNVWIFKNATVDDYNYVDSSYLNILLVNGLIILIMVLLIYSAMLKKSFSTGRLYMSWIIVFILVFSITEPRLMHLSYNPFVLLAFAGMSSIDGQERDKYRAGLYISPNGYKCRYVL